MPNVKIDPNDIAIRLKGLKKSFGPQTVLEDVNLDIRRGETMVIIGKSGGGKSVILKHMIGLLQPDGGEARITVSTKGNGAKSSISTFPSEKTTTPLSHFERFCTVKPDCRSDAI